MSSLCMLINVLMSSLCMLINVLMSSLCMLINVLMSSLCLLSCYGVVNVSEFVGGGPDPARLRELQAQVHLWLLPLLLLLSQGKIRWVRQCSCDCRFSWWHWLIDWLMITYIALYSPLCWADSLCSPVVLHEWLAFYSAFLDIHRSGVLTALAWLVPHETAGFWGVAVFFCYLHYYFSYKFSYYNLCLLDIRHVCEFLSPKWEDKICAGKAFLNMGQNYGGVIVVSGLPCLLPCSPHLFLQ